MRKFAFILAALIVVGVVVPAEAANRLQLLRSKVPTIVEAATKTVGKVGDGISSFFWRNKASIVTGTVLVTAATHPELVAESAVAVAQGPPTVTVQSGEYTVVPKRTRSVDWNVYVFLGGLLGILALIGMYGYGGRARTIAKIVGVVLLVGFVVSCCGVVRADSFDAEIDAMVNVPPWGWRVIWDVTTNIIMLVILLLVPT